MGLQCRNIFYIMIFMTISAIIKKCGGAAAISRASDKCTRQITYRGVLKWVVNGIPSHWFFIIMDLGGYTADEIQAANMRIDKYMQYTYQGDVEVVMAQQQKLHLP